VRTRIRRALLARDGPGCVDCGSLEGPFEIDHLIPLSEGGSDAIENLQTLCVICHAAKSAREARARILGLNERKPSRQW
jgi:5-methylcytosine-specific restriction protein A